MRFCGAALGGEPDGALDGASELQAVKRFGTKAAPTAASVAWRRDSRRCISRILACFPEPVSAMPCPYSARYEDPFTGQQRSLEVDGVGAAAVTSDLVAGREHTVARDHERDRV